MYDYISGTIAELLPTNVVIDNHGIGYLINISLQSYSALQNKESAKLYIYHHLREDDELLYGFCDKGEREIFVHLISISGIGPNTARMMLSSLTKDEVTEAIMSNDVNKIKSVKGIGLKTAQRVIIELKDKIAKGSGNSNEILTGQNNSIVRDEAISALVLLGFNKSNVEKATQAILKEDPSCSLELLIKKSLKLL